MSDRVIVVLDRGLANQLHHADTADAALGAIEHEVVAALDVDPQARIERVADAIHRADARLGDAESLVEVYRGYARAAIEALKGDTNE